MIRRRNSLLGLIAFLSICQVSLAQITIFPDVERRTDESVRILKIETTDLFTIVDLLYIPEEEDAWICADKNYYIQPEKSSERKYLIMAKEIPLCPDQKKVYARGEDYEFQLYFPSIDTSVQKIDIIEKPVSGFNFFGVWLVRKEIRPLHDSLLIASSEAFQSFFEKRGDDLKPLEGIWDLTIRRSKYRGDVFLEYLNEDPEILDVAMIWETDHYECYGMDGKSLEMKFSVIAEGGRYAYKEYFREIREEFTTFIYMEEENILEFRFNLPKRWAQYLLSGRLFDNENLVKIMSWEKIFPDPTKLF